MTSRCIYTPDHPKMDTSEPGSPGSLSDARSSTITANSSLPESPGIKNDNQNQPIPPTDINCPVPGWPALAKSIANKPAFEAFPSFTDLNVKSLLYYQAQLILLREKLHKEECNDYFNGDVKQHHYSENMELLIRCANRPGEVPPGQWKLIEDIRTVLAQYSKPQCELQHKMNIANVAILQDAALIQFSQISAFPSADSSNVKCLRNCARKAYDGRGLKGAVSKIWGPLGTEHDKVPSFWGLLFGLLVGFFKSQEEEQASVPKEFQEHLIVPRGVKKRDGLTLWVEQSFIPLFHFVWTKCGRPTWTSLWQLFQCQLCSCKLPRCREKRGSNASNLSPGSNDNGNGKFTAYSESWILRVTSILTTIVACILPVVAIVILSKVHTMGMILGLIALFNIVFAFGLAMISSDSSRTDIFTATAA